MAWNWQHSNWPRFTWDSNPLVHAEQRFLIGAGVSVGGLAHLSTPERETLQVEAMTIEAMTTSAIEGEMLDRNSVQSSVRRELGLAADPRRSSPREQGIAAMMVDLFRRPIAPLEHATLFAWHAMVCRGRSDLHPGAYRTHPEPMRVVSGPMDDPNVHVEAPPSSTVPDEMTRFINWFNRTAPGGPSASTLPALARTGIAHLYFESIHPFEDGNGRVGRAIAEFALSQHLGRPALTSLAATILRRQRSYYTQLEAANKTLNITPWLVWFAEVVLESQLRATAQIEFTIRKTRLLDAMRPQLNDRQTRVLLRILQEGLDGFTGGLSASNYAAIAKTPPATTTRDLGDMVAKGALTRTGENKGVRYHLPFPLPKVPSVVIRESGEIVEV